MSATNRGLERVENDHYPTQPWVTRAYVPTLKRWMKELGIDRPRIYEPAAGKELAIVKVLQAEWPEAIIEYSDINPAFPGGGVDFLIEPPEPIFDIVITNPPYKYAKEFIERALLWLRSPELVRAMFLRINFLGSKRRAKWWRQNKPSLAITPRRPSMGLNKHGKPGTDATEYAWYGWPQRDPVIEFLETEDTEGNV